MLKFSLLSCFSLLVLLVFNQQVKGQSVQFKNEQGKCIILKQGDQISLFYKGYLGQKQFSNIDFLYGTDSSIVVGSAVNPNNEKIANFLLMRGQSQKEILFKDILAFRRISAGRKLAKSTINILCFAGFALALNEISKNNKLNYGQSLAYSVVGGIGISLFINFILPENPKYNTNEGWQIQTLKK